MARQQQPRQGMQVVALDMAAHPLAQPQPSACSPSWLLLDHCCRCCCWPLCSCPAVLVPSCRCKQAVLGAGAGVWRVEKQQQQQLPRTHLGLCLLPSPHRCRYRTACQSAAQAEAAVSASSKSCVNVRAPCRRFVQWCVLTMPVPTPALLVRPVSCVACCPGQFAAVHNGTTMCRTTWCRTGHIPELCLSM